MARPKFTITTTAITAVDVSLEKMCHLSNILIFISLLFFASHYFFFFPSLLRFSRLAL
jgi:hypothetical protein